MELTCTLNMCNLNWKYIFYHIIQLLLINFLFTAVIRNVFRFPVLVYLVFLEHTVIVRQQFRNNQISLHFEVHRTPVLAMGLLAKQGHNDTMKFAKYC